MYSKYLIVFTALMSTCSQIYYVDIVWSNDGQQH